MNAMKRVMALLLILTLAISCLPLGALTAFAAEIEDPQIPEGLRILYQGQYNRPT